MRRSPIALLLAAAAVLGGCGVEDPYADNAIPRPSRPPTKSPPKTTPRAPRAPAPPRPAAGARSAPERAAASYAAAQGNYTPDSYRRQHRAMVALAGGPLRAELTRTPLGVLARGIEQAGASATTTVLATRLEPGRGKERSVTVAARQVVRTTSEGGRAAAEYLYFRATVDRRHARWRVLRFEASQ